MRSRHWGVVFAVGGLAVPAVVVASPTEAALSLSQAVDLARQHTESVEIAQTQEMQAAHRTTQARALFFPTLSVQGSYQQQDPSGASARVNPVFGAPQYYGRVNLTQNLFAGGKDWFGTQAAAATASAATETRLSTDIALYRETAALFYGVLAAERDLGHLQEVLKAGEKRMAELDARVRVGRSKKADGLAAVTQVSALRAQVELAQQQLKTQRGRLAIRLHVSDQVDLIYPESELPELQTLDAYLARVENRPDVKAQVLTVDSAQSSLWTARAGHLPTLDASGNVYFVRGGSQAGNYWDANILLQFPIFQGGVVAGAVREASERNKESELRLAQTRRLAREEILTAWESAQGAKAQALALKKAVADARLTYTEQERNYGFGQAQNLDVIQALNDWVEVRRNFDRARFQSWIAFTDLSGAAVLLPESKP